MKDERPDILRRVSAGFRWERSVYSSKVRFVMSSHAAVHAAKRKLQLSPGDAGPDAPKKFRVESVHSKSADSGIEEKKNDHLYGNSRFSSEDEDEQSAVWVEDHYKAEVCESGSESSP